MIMGETSESLARTAATAVPLAAFDQQHDQLFVQVFLGSDRQKGADNGAVHAAEFELLK